MDFDRALSPAYDIPPHPGVVDFLLQHGEDPERLYDRFVWEMRRGLEPEKALAQAQFAAALSDTPPTVLDGLQAIHHEVTRRPLLVRAGENRALDESVTVVNLHDRDLWVSESELLAAGEHTGGRPLTVLLDDGDTAARVTPDNRVLWTLPFPGDADDAWHALNRAVGGDDTLPGILAALASHRYPVLDHAELPSEHRVRADRLRRLLVDITPHYSYWTETDQVELEEDQVEEALGLVDDVLFRYLEQPRVVLAGRALDNFRPYTDWEQRGPRAVRALIAAVTGDDRHLSSLLAAEQTLRVGTLAFSGDPNRTGGDLLHATVPAAPCSIVLREHVLQQCVLLPGLPHPGADLPVPHRDLGVYSTVATADDLRDLARALVYLELAPVVADDRHAYFQGRSLDITLEGTPTNPAFHLFVGALAAADVEGAERREAIERGVTAAVGRALFQGLARDVYESTIAAVHVGSLTMADVEMVVLPASDEEEYVNYAQHRRLPEYLDSAKRYFDEFDVKLMLRPPLSAGTGMR